MSSRRLIAVAIAVAVLSTAGCSSKSDSSSNTNPPSTSDTKSQSSTQTKALPTDCPTPETMKAELGITYQAPATTATAKERNCNYFSGEGIAGVHFQIIPSAADFNAIKVGMSVGGRTVADISGLGDEAFSSVLAAAGGNQNTVGARKGTFVVILTSRASLDKEQAFVAKLLG